MSPQASEDAASPRVRTHRLKPATPGTEQQLLSLHYGLTGRGPKVLVQASLHADEVPAMLVAHHLRQRLGLLQAAGRLLGEVVLVPAANPVGLHQWLLRGFQGRFELASGQNFNRGYAQLAAAVADAVAGHLGADAARNVRLVRAALREAVAALPVDNTLDSLRCTLLGLAVDADLVLDLHCDGEGLLHFYATPQSWAGLQPLAACLGANPVLLAEDSGGEPFDEACANIWPQLAAHFGPDTPLPQACRAVTVELRGEADVDHALAARDAAAILHALALEGVVQGDPAGAATDPVPPPPPHAVQATPLAGSIPLVAPHGGVVVFLRRPGDTVAEGEPLAELIDPLSGQVTPLPAPASGLFFARENRRFAVAGMALGKVAGDQARRHGHLLSAR